MAIDDKGNGLAYTGDQDGVSVYTMKYAGVPVFEVGARGADKQILVRKPGDEWVVTEAEAMVREDGRVSGQFMHIFTALNVPKILLDLYVIPSLPLGDVPDGVPIDWKLED